MKSKTKDKELIVLQEIKWKNFTIIKEWYAMKKMKKNGINIINFYKILKLFYLVFLKDLISNN